MPHSESVLPLGVPIAPTEPTDANSTHIAEYGRGGLHSVADLAARTNISSDRKRVGMLVWVESEQKYYRLSALPDTWVELSAGGAGTVTSITPAADNGSGTAITTSGTITVAGTANEVTTSVLGTTVTVGLPDEITVVEVNTERLDFDTTPTTPAMAQGRAYWDAAYSTVALGLNASVELKIGNGLYKLCRNSTGSTIAKGSVVYVSGSHGGTQLMVALASNASEATSAETVGVAAESIANNASGFVQTFGYLEGLTTNGYAGAEGTPLYLDSTAGNMRSGLPTQPAHGVRIGFLVKKAGAGAGAIFVSIQNYQELDELSNVLSSSEADFDLLSYDLTAGVWRNRSVSNALPSGSVALSKIASIPTNRILGNSSGVSSSPQALSVSSPLGFNAISGNLEFVAPGTNGQVYYRSGGSLATTAKFAFDAASSTVTLTDPASSASATYSWDSMLFPTGFFQQTAALGSFFLGDYLGLGNGTLMQVDDSASAFNFTADTITRNGLALITEDDAVALAAAL